MFHFACGLFVTEDLQHAQIKFFLFHGLSSGIHGVPHFQVYYRSHIGEGIYPCVYDMGSNAARHSCHSFVRSLHYTCVIGCRTQTVFLKLI